MEPADTSDEGLLYEFVLNSDGSTTKIISKIERERLPEEVVLKMVVCARIVSLFVVVLKSVIFISFF